MASCLPVHISLVFLHISILLRCARGLPGTGLDSITEDIKIVQRHSMKSGFKSDVRLEVKCEHEYLTLTCDAGEIINIMDAEYGRNDKISCASYPSFNSSQCSNRDDTLYRVKQRCHNKRKCCIRSSNDEFGDPCPNIIKYLKVRYACKPVQFSIRESVTLCESNSKQINCPKGTSIMITDALYGRNDNTTCCCRLMNNTQCLAKNSIDIVSARCDYKQSCTLEAKNEVFGDPCYGTIKYLKVDYLCLPAPHAQCFVGYVFEKKRPWKENFLASKEHCACAASKIGTLFHVIIPGKVLHVRNCEGDNIRLECEKNSFIQVIDAHYGRAHPFICLSSKQPVLKNCGSTDITSSVKERCQGASGCSFSASNELFGDPCFGYTKYLDVEYSCNKIFYV